MRKLLLVGLFAICAMPAWAQNAIRFGVDPTFPPYESLDPSGKMVGIDIEMGNTLCKKMNVTCEWVRITFDGAIPALKAKKIDAILSAMTVTEKRKKQVLFTDPLYASTSRLLLPKDKTLESTAESVKGKTIGIVQGTTQAAYANKHWRGKGVNLVTYQSDELVLQDLALGRVDATLQNTAAAKVFFETPDGSRFHLTGEPVKDPEVFGHGVGIGLNLGDTALQGKINTALSEMHGDGSYDEILKRYEKYGLENPVKK